ncbi:hypothetical protein GCM10010124_13830 [Pilimelia terevasa]|uniref:DUF4360 domain-containing protein n=1 Tax=Pilimelia terevasa TaxID=53372 RepID=A0A8J3BLB1_9ACTN|nr:DUF4360 domain-containing protein [Pilimelia terevasa]GGK22557.1 hypothetical protein GCM10010124_13830 [Pilimelia terevasa]
MNAIRYTALGTAVLLALAVPASPARAAAADDSPKVKITGLTFNGSGCTRGDDPLVHLENGGRRLTVEFSGFHTQAGLVPRDNAPRVWVPRANRNCQVGFTLAYSPGWTFALTGVDGIGFADVDQAASTRRHDTYYFAGMTQTDGFTTVTDGPYTGTYHHANTAAAPNWSECGKARGLNVNSRIQVDASKADRASLSEVTMDAMIVNLGWKRC